MGSPLTTMRKPLPGQNVYENPEDEPRILSHARNQQWSDPNYKPTQLSPSDELKFQVWGRMNPKAVRGEMTPDADYDMRGYWKALTDPSDPNHALTGQAANGHYSDRWKTPYSGVFSRESMYATPNAPQWEGNTLVDGNRRVAGDRRPSDLVTMKRPLPEGK